MTNFNYRDIYDKKIQPIVHELKKQCELNQIPMFVTCCVANTEEKGTLYRSDAIGTGSRGIELKDDHIEKHLCVANGFFVKPPNVGNELSDEALEYIGSLDDEDFLTESF